MYKTSQTVIFYKCLRPADAMETSSSDSLHQCECEEDPKPTDTEVHVHNSLCAGGVRTLLTQGEEGWCCGQSGMKC